MLQGEIAVAGAETAGACGMSPTAAWCIRMFFIAAHLLKEHAELLFERYGFLPGFKAALHCGEFVVGEVGDIKCQLVLYGDAIYETQKIEKACSKMKQPFLVSGEFMERVILPGIYQSEHCTDLEIGDKRIELFSICEKEAGIV